MLMHKRIAMSVLKTLWLLSAIMAGQLLYKVMSGS